MEPGPLLHSSRTRPGLCHVFPFRLKYVVLGSRVTQQLGVRRFSTRSFRSRLGTSSEFTSNRDREEVPGSKSLVEDEAELNDWVSGLRTDKFRGRLTSDDEELNLNRGRNRDRDRYGGRDRDTDRRRESYKMKRRRERDVEELDESSRRRTRSSGELFSRNSRFSKGFAGELEKEEEDEEGFLSRRKNRENQKKNAGSLMGKRNEKNLYSGFRRGGGRQEGLKKQWNNSRKETRFIEEEDVEHDDNDADVIDFDEERRRVMGDIGDLLSEEGSDEDGDDSLFKSKASSALGLDKEVNKKDASRSSPGKSDSYLSEISFDQCPISPLSLKGIKDAGYEKMTVVQESTLPVILKGKDVLAKAKTGTGKTVAFLLPSIEVVVKSPPVSRDNKRPPILVLVICPTRELACQAAAEANTLLKYHPSIGVQVVIGGTRLALEQKRMQANPCQILVATPGRLRDHVENTAGFATRLTGVKVLVLDEADHLLDMGFRKDIEKIIAAVPKQRQTLLFSATIPEEVRQICHIALKRDHEFINTVQEGTGETHSQVRQMHIVAPLDKHFSLLYVLLKEHIADDVDYKVLVFCTTAMVTRLVADFLGELNSNVREIHSRKPQSYRTRVSDEFRKSKGLILVTSDVSARGVDYPDVTLVIQVGLPADRQQYIHRLGRTGRKGKEGEGVLLLSPWEEFFLSAIKDLPISKTPAPSIDPDTEKKVERALCHVEMKNKEAAYQAWLGYYNSNKTVGKDKYRLVELANEFSRSMGLDNPPAIPKLVLGKMGLRNIPGLRSK